MGKTYRDNPAKKREIEFKKHERGDHRKMDPYNRANMKKSSWDQHQQF